MTSDIGLQQQMEQKPSDDQAIFNILSSATYCMLYVMTAELDNGSFVSFSIFSSVALAFATD
jgi:hypothetical protein